MVAHACKPSTCIQEIQPQGLGVQGHPPDVRNTRLEWIAYNPIPQQRKKKEDPEKEKGFPGRGVYSRNKQNDPGRNVGIENIRIQSGSSVLFFKQAHKTIISLFGWFTHYYEHTPVHFSTSSLTEKDPSLLYLWPLFLHSPHPVPSSNRHLSRQPENIKEMGKQLNEQRNGGHYSPWKQIFMPTFYSQFYLMSGFVFSQIIFINGFSFLPSNE